MSTKVNRAPWEVFGAANPDPLSIQVPQLYNLDKDFSQSRTMTSTQRSGRQLALLVMTVCLAILAIAPAAVADDESEITFSCFVGNTDEGNYIGDITENAPENAAENCNSTYDDCHGDCIACFTNADLDRQTCYDKIGRKVDGTSSAE